VGPGFSPLGERLRLIPGRLSPAMVALAVRFGTHLPFAKAAELLNAACGTTVTHDTVRRLTERAGAVWRQIELDLATTLETAALTPQAEDVAIPDRDPVAVGQAVQLSLDGAMVPLRHGEWAEVRTVVVGAITTTAHGPTATALSYVSRLCPATAFGQSMLGELDRRAVLEHPGPVVAVSDGAPWIQELLDLQCPQAVRVLDLMHAIGYLADAAKAAFGPGTEATSDWLGAQRAALKRGETDHVLTVLAALPESGARDTAVRYLTARRAMLAYDQFVAAGWPIGSGVVESANKLVVEARLKGAGMHWRREHADALVGLRALDASNRWEHAWPRIVDAWRGTPRPRTATRRAAPPTMVASARPPDPVPAPLPPVPPPKSIINGKPTPDHPWKRGPVAPRRDHSCPPH
jgi:hypothetical protein